jgi:hypothetical protein
LRMLIYHPTIDTLCIRGYRYEAHYGYERNLSHHPSVLITFDIFTCLIFFSMQRM